jgi:hypothetical protein
MKGFNMVLKVRIRSEDKNRVTPSQEDIYTKYQQAPELVKAKQFVYILLELRNHGIRSNAINEIQYLVCAPGFS